MTPEVHFAIAKEQNRQLEKWGEQYHSAEMWLAILVEETGELAQAILNTDTQQLVKELVQTAAVCATWLDRLDSLGNSL
jgi:NTP pyrophosphatase (non-canonical NTP hydrolase)